jgi:prophage antirepressor-like protein
METPNSFEEIDIDYFLEHKELYTIGIDKKFNSTNNIFIKGTFEDPLFRAIDIGDILDVDIHTLINDFDDSEIVTINMYIDGGTSSQQVIFLTESGLYKLLFNNTLPLTKKLIKWTRDTIKDFKLSLNTNHKNEIIELKKEIVKLKEIIEMAEKQK